MAVIAAYWKPMMVVKLVIPCVLSLKAPFGILGVDMPHGWIMLTAIFHAYAHASIVSLAPT